MKYMKKQTSTLKRLHLSKSIFIFVLFIIIVSAVSASLYLSTRAAEKQVIPCRKCTTADCEIVNRKKDLCVRKKPAASPAAEVSPDPNATPSAAPEASPSPSPLIGTKKVGVYIIDPIMVEETGETLIGRMQWHDPEILSQSLIQNLSFVSHDSLKYEVSSVKTIHDFPIFSDKYDYTPQSWTDCWYDHTKCHTNSYTNYSAFISDNGICEDVNSGLIDEVWVWAGPWVGNMHSSVMVGPKAFQLSGPPVTKTSCKRMVPLMVYNPAGGVDSAVATYARRASLTLTRVLGKKNSLWSDFQKYDQTRPGKAQCGTTEIPPNGKKAYDFTNQNEVLSSCDRWNTFPEMSDTQPVLINCTAWNCSMAGYFEYWASHIPHVEGKTGKYWDNWWYYVADYDKATAKQKK
jgi:hypothetical protein